MLDDATPLEDGRRLHPLTLVQRLALSLPAFALLLLPTLRGGDSQSWFALVAAVVYAVLAIPLIFLRYFRFRYKVTTDEVIIQSGVLTRRHRSIPVERIQNIEIEQSLLPRMLGTAKVKIETAGSSGAEGVLEFVSLHEARAIRQSIRSFQREQQAPAPASRTQPVGSTYAAEEGVEAPAATPPEPMAPAPDEVEETVLFTMPLARVLLSGVFRFSLLYIALIFSGLQYINLEPEDIVDWITGREFDAVADVVNTSPFLAAFAGVLMAALLSWLAGIAVNLNKYYNFRLWLEDNKLHKRHGLLTVSEGTIPLRRVQALILRSNPLMEHYGWQTLQLQTMGFDVNQQGHQVAAPFAQKDALLQIAPHIFPFMLPETFHPVSRLTIRRAFIRYTVGLLLVMVPLAYFWRIALWGLVLIPFLLYFAVLRYRHHGYAVQDDILYVRHGVIRRYLWIVPLQKFQVFYTSASFFQRRLGLKSVLIDTAGAGSFAYPEVVDLPAEEADALEQHLYRRFQAQFSTLVE